MSAGRGPETTLLNQRLNALETLTRYLSPKALEAVNPSLKLQTPEAERQRKPEEPAKAPQEK